MNDGWHNNGWGGGHWIFAIVMMILFWGVIATIVLGVFRSGSWSLHSHHSNPAVSTAMPGTDAERILHERFARGEIDEAEYTRRHDLLKERSC